MGIRVCKPLLSEQHATMKRKLEQDPIYNSYYHCHVLTHEQCFVFFVCLVSMTLVRWHSCMNHEAWSVTHRSDLVRSSLRVVVLRRPAGAENPIPSSCFSKSVSKSVAESSELFSKVSRSSLSFSAETKDIICELKFEFVVTEIWSHLRLSRVMQPTSTREFQTLSASNIIL